MNHRSLTPFIRLRQGRPRTALPARAALALSLALMLGLASPLGLIASAQTSAGGGRDGQTGAAAAVALKKAYSSEAYVIYQGDDGETVCRDASPLERSRITESRSRANLRQIYPLPRKAGNTPGGDGVSAQAAADSGMALLPSAGLRIVLHGTAQLEANPQAKQAFIVAANRWESLVSTPITVVIDVDYGPTFFDTPYNDPDILGQAGTSTVGAPVSSLRTQLLRNDPTAEEFQLYSELPSIIPAEFNSTAINFSNLRIPVPAARALGLTPDITNPDVIALGQGDAGIGFNSAFGFDFTPDDNGGIIDAGKTDFDAVAVHEIGHALGFSSRAGGTTANVMALWDVFRFRGGTVSLANFGTAPRQMSAGGTQISFINQVNSFGTQETGLSTGGPNGNAAGGDGRQSSHWKDDFGVVSQYIGIMDPNIGRGQRKVISSNDLKALDSFGYKIGGVAPPPPPPPPPPAAPANDHFVNAIIMQGASGTLTGTNQGATQEFGEPQHTEMPGGKSVWFRWVAPGSGNATIDTRGSDFDTTLAVYVGGALNALGPVALSDDIVLGQDTDSSVLFPVTAGTTYQIKIDGFDNGDGAETGAFNLNWSGPAAAPTPTPTPTPAPTFNIAGSIKDGAGVGVGGLSVGIEGPALPSSGLPHPPVVTDLNGNFTFNGLAGGGNYTVTPLDQRFTYSPVSATVSNLSANQNLAFTATLKVVNAAGRVTEAGTGLGGVTVTLLQGDLERGVTTTDAGGNYQFTSLPLGEAFRVVPSRTGYGFSPASVNFVATGLGSVDMVGFRVGSINDPAFFVRQHYLDFLGREPDTPGLNFWVNQLTSCGGNIACNEVRRINVSASFFLSIEFQETGVFGYRLHKAAFGNLPGKPVPVTRAQFLADSALLANNLIVNAPGWEQQLETNKQTFVNGFVLRPEFAALLAASPIDFVNTLNTNTGGSLTQPEVDALVNQLTANNTPAGRALVLRAVAQNAEFTRREKSPAFVLMEYFGYLRRDPDAAPNTDFSGYNFWLGKLNQFGGNFIQAEMVKAFITSGEYLQRFPTP